MEPPICIQALLSIFLEAVEASQGRISIQLEALRLRQGIGAKNSPMV